MRTSGPGREMPKTLHYSSWHFKQLLSVVPAADCIKPQRMQNVFILLFCHRRQQMRHTYFCVTSSNTQRQSGSGAAPGQSQTSAEHIRRQAQPSALLPVSAGELEEHGVSASLRFLRSSVSPKCPSTEEWIRRWSIYIHNGILLGQEKGQFNCAFATTWMDLEIIIPSDARKRQISYSIVYTWNLNYDTNELLYETETDSQTSLSWQERTDLPRGRAGREEMEWDLGISKLVCKEQVNNRSYHRAQGNILNSLYETIMKKNVCICVCVCVCV